MATLTPIDKERMNPREANILEEAKLRKIAIQNMQRDNLEAKSIWRDKQMKSYGNLVAITDEIPLSKIITDEQQAQSQDEFLQRQHAMANLNTIADPPNVEYIVDRLNPEQMRYMNDNWVGLLRSIKKKNSRMDKNVFVNAIVDGEQTGMSYDDVIGAAPTQAMQNTAALKASQANDVADRLAAQRQIEEDRQAAEQQAGVDLNAQRDGQQRQARIAALTAQNQARMAPRNILTKLKTGLKSAKASQPAPVSQTITPPQSPRYSSPLKAAASAAVASSNISAIIQQIADAKLAASAGGSQNIVSPLVQVGPTIGNAVNVSGGGGSSQPPSAAVITVPPPPGLVRSKSNMSVSDTDIEKSIKIQPPTAKEETDYQNEIIQINDKLSKMSTVEVKSKLNKSLGKVAFNETCDQLKQLAGISNLNENLYKKLYFLTEIEKLRGNSSSSSGTGLRKKRVIRGRGYTKHEHATKKPKRHYVGERYYVDINKLDDNILCVKYASNDSNLPRLKVQQITQKTVEIIKDILNNKFDDRIFKILTSDEKRMVNRFIKAVKLDITVNDDDEKEFQRQFEIVRGEYMSGNDSPQIKNTLKRYVLEALQENKIARNDGYNLLYSLSL